MMPKQERDISKFLPGSSFQKEPDSKGKKNIEKQVTFALQDTRLPSMILPNEVKEPGI